jgi:DNA uptake protein ComE-like DNA-binding protein
MANIDLKSTPDWVWWTLVPIAGGLVISYIGYKHKLKKWVNIGLAIAAGSTVLMLASPQLFIGSFICFGTALMLKREYNVKVAPRGSIALLDRETSTLVAKIKGQIDINKCSKDDLVRGLGLPIVYANDIELLRNSGYIFTHIEELTDLIGIPTEKCQVIEPAIAFNYYDDSHYFSNWQRLNLLPMSELVELGIDRLSADTIVAERQRAGNYRSLVDIQKRTGLPINLYKHLI